VNICSKDVSTLTVISGLRVTPPFYIYLVKYNVTYWSEVLYRAQPYIQLEEIVKSFANQSLNCGDDREKLKSHHGSPLIDNQGHRRGAFKKQM